MGESPDKNLGDGKKAESETESQAIQAAASESTGAGGEKPEGRSIDNNLPVVWSPKLGARDGMSDESPESDAHEGPSSDDEAVNEAPNQTAAAAPRAHSSRFALLAASVAVVAALGSFVGSLSASGFVHFWPAAAARSNATEASAASALAAIKAELAELSTLKANLDGATRSANGQFAKIADRLDHVERAQTDPATKIAHIADTVDRLDKRSAAAPETTGTIAAGQAPATEPKLPDRILADWIVRGVRGGRALVFNRYGGVFDVASGNILPGLGRVETIKREDGQWIVVTARGVITSGR
jgi:hypothetical protein